MPFDSLVAVAFGLWYIRKSWERKKQFTWVYVRKFLYVGAIGSIINDKEKVISSEDAGLIYVIKKGE